LTLFAAALLALSSSAVGFDVNDTFLPMFKVISDEGAVVNFTTGRMAGGYINAWNVGARVSLLPFGVIHNGRVLGGALDGALEVGLASASVGMEIRG